MNDKKECPTHQLPNRPPPDICKRYGLWVFNGIAGAVAPEDSFDDYGDRYFDFYCISHMYEGGGKLRLPSGEQDVQPGDCIFVRPGIRNNYGGSRGLPYCEDTVNFIGPAADQLAAAGLLPNGIIHIGRMRRLLSIIRFIHDPAEDSLIRANIELQKFITDVFLERHEAKQEYPLFQKLLEEIRTHLDRWWTVREMAETCNLSDDQLRRVFLEYTGTTPKLYVDRLKIARAGELLQMDDRSIREIAESLGYVDQYHFSRRFKQIQGVSPIQHRQASPFYQKTKRTI